MEKENISVREAMKAILEELGPEGVRALKEALEQDERRCGYGKRYRI